MISQKLTSFIRSQLLIEREDNAGPCVKMVLKHVQATGKQGEVDSFDCKPFHAVSNNEKKESFIENLISEIEGKAHDDAEPLGGVQRYCLYVYFKAQAKPLGRCAFRVDAGDAEDDEDGEISSEPATKGGIVSQQMRHNEAIMRTSVMSTNHMMGIMQRTIDSQAETINNLLTDKYKNLEVMEKMLSMSTERKLMEQQAALSMKLKEETFNTLKLLGPTVINRIAKQKILPESTNPLMMGLKALRETITMEQLGALQQIFTPAQMIGVVELLKSVSDEDEGKQEDESETKQ